MLRERESCTYVTIVFNNDVKTVGATLPHAIARKIYSPPVGERGKERGSFVAAIMVIISV